jgi:ribonucleotide monophosphatase NagD (HAD superfamily)
VCVCDVATLAPSGLQVYVVGERGIMDELAAVGITSFGGPDDNGKTVSFSQEMQQDPAVAAVVCGVDPGLSYFKERVMHAAGVLLRLSTLRAGCRGSVCSSAAPAKGTPSSITQPKPPLLPACLPGLTCSCLQIQYASLCLLNNPGCLFIATNADARGHFTANQEWAGAGATVGAIKGALCLCLCVWRGLGQARCRGSSCL